MGSGLASHLEWPWLTPILTLTLTLAQASVVLMISMGTAVSSFGELRMDFMGLGLMLASVSWLPNPALIALRIPPCLTANPTPLPPPPSAHVTGVLRGDATDAHTAPPST